jgi:signal transduction histidine kinase
MWWFITLAFALAAVTCFFAGFAWVRHRLGKELRAVRGEARRMLALQRHWSFETDREHKLRHWRAPAMPPREADAVLPHADAGRTLFSHNTVAAEGLRSHLRSERAFCALRVRVDEVEWIIDGLPRQDDKGQFAGFVGQAQPLAVEDDLGAGADTLRQLLALFPGPALLALQQPDHWAVHQLSARAQMQWPRLAVGTDLASAFGSLPESFVSALHIMPPGGTVEATGWRLARFRAENGRHAVLIARTEATPEGSEALGSTLAHDLRAPLRVVEGFTRIVKEDYGALLDRVGNEHLERVMGATARMNAMIDALLALSRLDSHPLARQPVDLSQLAEFVVQDLQRSAPERRVEVTVEPHLSATGDPTLLRLVLEKLLGNAWKFSAHTPAARIKFCRVTQGGRPAFAVLDNGAGFDMRSAERLFGLFQRLHSASEFPGHGVGLAAVKRIVQRHGGEVGASGQVGAGASFTFTLP